MKLVLEYEIGDGYTYNCTDIIPVEYESPEALYCDLLDEVKKERKSVYFYFLGQEFNSSYLKDGDFIIHKLDEWFEKNRLN
jgi:hypothetical protein